MATRFLDRPIVNLRAATSVISRALNYIGGGLLIAIVLITVGDVFMRRVFNSPIRASMELTELFVGTVVFFSLGYCAFKGGHIALDILVSRFPRPVRLSTIIIMDFISTAMCGILCWRLIVYALDLYHTHAVSIVLLLPTYIFSLLGALGFAVLTLAFLLDFSSSLAEVRRR